MKYPEISLNDYVIDPCLTLYRIEESDDRIDLFAKSRKHACNCPACGISSEEQHSTYERAYYISPLRSKPTQVHAIVSTYECGNPNCSTKYFTEPMTTVGLFQHYSYDVQVLVFAISLFVSARGTETIMKYLGIPISHDAIQDLYSSMEIQDDPDIEGIGVDDVANRKGQSYFTAIYSLKDHSMLALLDGRDGATLKKWLEDHKKVKLVARDRASAYASAIKEVLGDACVQVADRFHLLKNILDCIKELFKEELPKYFFIKDGEILDEEPAKETVPIVSCNSESFSGINYDNSEPLDSDGNPIQFNKKLVDYDSKQYKDRELRRFEKTQMAIDIRAEAYHSEAETPDIEALASQFGVTPYIVNKYLSLTDEEVADLIVINEQESRGSKFDPYVNITYKMLRDGHSPEFVYSYLIYIGCSIKPSVLSVYVGLIAKNNFGFKTKMGYAVKKAYPENITVIRRNDLAKYIAANNRECETVKNVEPYFNLICSHYPVVKEVEQTYVLFHSILMGDSPDEMDLFVEEKKNSPISSFIEGIKKDIAAVKHAISYETNSGFVEGNNTKFKLIKRILAGRSGIGNLYRKCYAAFTITHTDRGPRELLNI